MEKSNEPSEEPPITELLGIGKRGRKARKKTGGTAKKDDVPVENPTSSAEDRGNGPRVTVSAFDYSVENHFRAVDTISQLCGEADEGGLEESEVQRLASTITFLREWKYFNYEPRTVRFACEVGSLEGKDAVSGIKLPQFSSATVPKEEASQDAASVESSKDFVLYVGGHVWALDWCPRVHEMPEDRIKCEFIAIAAHPPGSSYHKIGAPLTGRGIVQIWCFLNVSSNEEEVPPLIKKQKGGPKNTGAMEENSTLLKRPRGRPRKKPEEDDKAKTTQPKRPRGRPRKIQVEKKVGDLDCNDDKYPQDLAVQVPEDSTESLAIVRLSQSAGEQAVQEDNSKKQNTYKQAASACNPADVNHKQGRRLKNNKNVGSYNGNISLELSTANVDIGPSVGNHQMQQNSGQEAAASESLSHSASLGISSASSLISKDIALPRVVLCLAHNGKVAWDVKWRPPDAHDSKCKLRMGYLAVLLGNGSVEVWDVPLPRTVKVLYSSSGQEGTDPRFAKLEPVFRCSMLKCGGTQSIPLTVEWSPSPPHDYLLAGCHDGTVALWKFSASSSSRDTKPLLCFRADTVPIRAVAWSPHESDPESANVILTAGHGGLKFWDLRDPFRPLWDLHPAPRIIYSLDWLPEPRCVIISFDDGTMRTLSLVKAANDAPVTGEHFGGTKQQGLHSYYCSSFAIWSVQVSRLTGMAAYCSADGTVLRFQLTSKAVDNGASRNRTPHFLCGSLIEEGSAVTINTSVPNTPLPLKKSFNKNGDTSTSLREFPLEPRPVKRVSDKRAKSPRTDAQTLALCYGDSPGAESGSEEASPMSKKKPTKKREKTYEGDLALVCRDEEPLKIMGKENGKVEAPTVEAFPSKLVAMHRVRWNMNKGSEKWLCYGGAAGLVRCQEIVLSEVDKKLAMKR